MMTQTETILVTGGAGYIGSHTVIALEEAGYRTLVFDDFSTGHRDSVFGTHLIEGDIRNTDRLAKALRDHEVSGVIHFAALTEAGVSVREPLAFFQNNVAGTLSVLDAMLREGVHKLVLSSTAAVYGDQASGDLLSESLPRAPINPYGASKAMVEEALEACCAAYPLSAIALRYFNAAGADAEGRTGERHSPETHLIPLAIGAAMSKRPPIRVFGTDYPTPDGTCIRDYVHVCDLADAHVRALDALLGGKIYGFRAFNLGTGKGHSVREVLNAVAACAGRAVPSEDAEQRPGDPACLVAALNAAKIELGWTARRSDIERIVRDAWRFHNGLRI